ncbi:MAG TPA: metallophosphoesterase [Geobacteraceae bacterium]|nr:metallophosphoesterase [Geobacteraceae bacterium]
MKIAVLSDTHGNYPLAIQALDRIADIDCIIHLGDTIQDAEIIECALSLPIIKLAGNCDPSCDAPRELVLTIRDTIIYLTHGDLFQVKNDLEKICRKAASENARIALYGHTHIPTIQKNGEILLVNPGSLKKTDSHQSLAILSIKDGEASAEIVAIANNEFPSP